MQEQPERRVRISCISPIEIPAKSFTKTTFDEVMTAIPTKYSTNDKKHRLESRKKKKKSLLQKTEISAPVKARD